MSEPLVTMSQCPYCGESVQASQHYTMECIANLRQQRDEAQEAAGVLLALLQSSAADHDHDEGLFAQWAWLKEEQASE